MRPQTMLAIVLAVSGSALGQSGARVVMGPRLQPQTHQHFRAPIFLGGAWYPGYGTDIVQTTPQVIVLQAPTPAAPVVKEDSKPITPLMIELQGGQYIRSDRVDKPTQPTTANAVTKTKVTAAQ